MQAKAQESDSMSGFVFVATLEGLRLQKQQGRGVLQQFQTCFRFIDKAPVRSLGESLRKGSGLFVTGRAQHHGRSQVRKLNSGFRDCTGSDKTVAAVGTGNSQDFFLFRGKGQMRLGLAGKDFGRFSAHGRKYPELAREVGGYGSGDL